MSARQLECFIAPYKPEESNAVNQLCEESIKTLCPRNYNSQQVQALASCYSPEFSAKHIDIMNNIATFLNTVSPRNPDKPTAITAHFEDRIVGYASIVSYNLLSNDSLLAQLFVHPEYARQKVGTRLLQTLENNMADRCKVIKIQATLTGEPFYQANGYQSIEQYSSFIRGVRIPFVCMEKWLTEPSEIEKFFWETSQQGIRNVEWLTTETEALVRGVIDRN